MVDFLARSKPAFLASENVQCVRWRADKHRGAVIDYRLQPLRSRLSAAGDRHGAEFSCTSQPAQNPINGPNEKAK